MAHGGLLLTGMKAQSCVCVWGGGGGWLGGGGGGRTKLSYKEQVIGDRRCINMITGQCNYYGIKHGQLVSGTESAGNLREQFLEKPVSQVVFSRY